jgi:transcriptional pleiotropic repressor
MSTLLDKTRTLNKILQKSGMEPVIFNDICEVLSEVLGANIYIISRKGKIIGSNVAKSIECEFMKNNDSEIMRFTEKNNLKLLSSNETVANLQNNGSCVFDEEIDCGLKNKLMTIVPIIGNRERLGTLLLARFDKTFDDDDLILGEYSATIVGLEILRSKSDEIELETRKKTVVQLAIGTLSYSELEAIEYIFEELDGNEGLLIASKIAEKVGITRSVIVNALRKFESAGVLESRSLGMKGTYIKILNDKLLDELKKIK